MPRPGSRVIPDGWEAHHQPTAEATMTAECVITRPSSAQAGRVFDEVTGRTTYPTPAQVYAGPCRLQRADVQALPVPVGQKPTTLRRYDLALPLAAARVQVDDLVTMTAATDPDTVGRRLRVIDVRAGSLVWQQDLVCEEQEPTSR